MTDRRQDERALTTEDFAHPRQGDRDAAQERPLDDRSFRDDVVPAHREPDADAHPRQADDTAYADQPEHAEPRHIRPEDADPRYTEPGHTEPGHTEPGHSEPGDVAEPQEAEAPAAEPSRGPERPDVQLFAEDEVDRYREQWRALQGDFVDSPREAVHRADELVAQVIQSLATTFAEHKRSLEGQWQEGEQVDTEELRLALQRYRSFFERLTTV